MYVITLPLFIETGIKKKRKFYLNLNIYRNAHHHILNNAKIAFKAMVINQINKLPVMGRITMTFKVFPGSKRLLDIPNICSVVDKFFTDALVEAGKIEDDNYTVVPRIIYEYGEIDKENPRVEVTITPLEDCLSLTTETKEEPMKITIDQTEIHEAITDYVGKMFTLAEDANVVINLRATRGEEGMTADIDITHGDAPVAVVEVKPRNKPGPKPKNKPVIVDEKEGGKDPEPAANSKESVEGESATKEEVTSTTKPSLFAKFDRPDNSKGAE